MPCMLGRGCAARDIGSLPGMLVRKGVHEGQRICCGAALQQSGKAPRRPWLSTALWDVN